MGRISESVTLVALSEIRPKVFLGVYPYILLLVTGAAGRTAGSGLLSGLVTCAAGRATIGGLFSRLVTGTACSCGGSSRLLIPAKKI